MIWIVGEFASTRSIKLLDGSAGVGGDWGFWDGVFIARDWMYLAAFSFRDWGLLSVFMIIVLISLLVILSSMASGSEDSVGGWFARFLPFALGLLWLGLGLGIGMGFIPRQFLLALHSMWPLVCSLLQLTQFGFSSGGWSSVRWSFNVHVRHLSCLQLAVRWENILHLLHW